MEKISEESKKSLELVEIDKESKEATRQISQRLKSEIEYATSFKLDKNTLRSFDSWITAKCDSEWRRILADQKRIQDTFEEYFNPKNFLENSDTVVEKIRGLYISIVGYMNLITSLRQIAYTRILEFWEKNKLDFEAIEKKLSNAEMRSEIDKEKFDDKLKIMDVMMSDYEELKAQNRKLMSEFDKTRMDLIRAQSKLEIYLTKDSVVVADASGVKINRMVEDMKSMGYDTFNKAKKISFLDKKKLEGIYGKSYVQSTVQKMRKGDFKDKF